MSAGRHNRVALLLILLAGFALRAFRLGAGSLWYDETVSVYLAGSPLPELLRHTAGDIHPPGYYLLLRAWLLVTGFPTGHADPQGQGLEFAAALLSLFFGVLVIALVYRLAGMLGGRATALAAAALIALSPYNIWYSQEVRMYTLGAAFGVIAVGALWRAAALTPTPLPGPGEGKRASPSPLAWWAVYAIAATCGLYTLYYFAFLLLPINLWAAAKLLDVQRSGAGAARLARAQAAHTAHGSQPASNHSSFAWRHFLPWVLANLTVLILYAPWLPAAWRQATQPPVPPWRAAVGLLPALSETWTALTAGQSLPAILWPAVLLLIPVYLLGLYALARRDPMPISDSNAQPGQPEHDVLRLTLDSLLLLLATFGALAVVLLASAATPLYHVRYVFTYSPFFYIVLAAGLVWLGTRRRLLAALAGAAWVVLALAALAAFWADPQFRPDDHRAAVAYLQERWRPGDAVLINAGYAYPALLTYWQPDPRAPGSPTAWLERLTASPPGAGDAGEQRFWLAGHVDGKDYLGWGDPRADFFAMPAGAALQRIAQLYAAYPRIWQYRIYDTVTDPGGKLRSALETGGQVLASQRFPGESSLRVQGFLPRNGLPDRPAWPAATSGAVEVRSQPLPPSVASGGDLRGALLWRVAQPVSQTLATSLRLVGPDGMAWAQPPDDRPFGPLYTSDKWQAGVWQQQSLALPIPVGTPPGSYDVQLLVYDAATGQPLRWSGQPDGLKAVGDGLRLGTVLVERAAPQSLQPARAAFGPLDLLAAGTPASAVSPGDPVPVDLTWQAGAAPREPYVVVLQLLDATGKVAASLEEQPLDGRYGTQAWAAGEVVRDRHALQVPASLKAGEYRLIVGLYRAADGLRLRTPAGVFGTRPYLQIKKLIVSDGE